MSDKRPERHPPTPRRSRLRRLARAGWVPDQHGAWPMALVPPVVGAVLGGVRPVHMLLVAAWIAAFLLFNAAGLWMRSPRRARYRMAVRTWGVTTVVLGVGLLAWHPELLRWAPLFLPLVAVAIEEAWTRRERSMASRLSTVLASSLTCAVSAGLGGMPTLGRGWWPWRDAVTDPSTGWARVWIVTALLTAYFVGTVPYVRSLIRGRGERRWVVASAVWHVVLVAGAGAAAHIGGVHWSVVVMGLVVFARAVVVPLDQSRRGPWPAVRIGMLEMVLCLLVALAVVVPPAP